jgi:uroporphyrin-III C-methyltransferase / precorrin-2 dehydrogenase / sirohydrochlorin ferrochelatase
MQHFPIFLELAGRPCLVVGGGTVAARKVELLLKARARVTVVAPTLGPALARLAEAGRIAHAGEPFAPGHLTGHILVIAATDRRAVNAAVSRAAQAAGVPVNVVDDARLSSFIMPAIVDRAPVTVAVSSGGAAPVLSRLVRARIEAALPAATGRLAELAARLRPIVRRRLPGPARRRFWESLFEGRIAALVLAGREGEAEALACRALDDAAAVPVRGEVVLVGAGPGDPDLLTLGALRALQSADVIAHDRLVAPEILELARRDAERIDVGKRCGDGGSSQERTNRLLVALAREGKRVVRLKGGDPFVFGRGGEEMAVLAEAGVPVRVVPGVTAATGCTALAGIPLTHRDHAHAVTFVSGHRRKGAPAPDWASLARPGHTLVVYMGLATLAETAASLCAGGLDPATPAAAIENGSRSDQRVVTATLATLAARVAAAGLTGPALVVVGEVVALRDVLAAQPAAPDGAEAADVRRSFAAA